MGGRWSLARRSHRDDAGRLTTATPEFGQAYSYECDVSGRRTLRTQGQAQEARDDVDPQDRLLGYAGARFGYNAMGQRISATDTPTGDWAYDYDVNGGLRQVNGDNTTVEYVLDSSGRRIARREDGGALTWWMYDGLHPIAEFDANLRLRKRFYYGVTGHVPEYMTVHGDAGDSERYHFVTNLVGSVVGVLNDDGEWVERTDYSPFGRPTVLLAAPAAVAHPFGFAGGIKDAATGLVRFGARDYDPFTGQWLAKDPIRFAGGDSNLYGYVGNDPVRFFDPTGLLIEVPAGADFSCIGIACWSTVGPDPEFAGALIAIAMLHPALRIVRGGVAILRLAWRSIQRRRAEERKGGKALNCPEHALVEETLPPNPVLGKPRVGSALKDDPHHAFPDILDNFASDAQNFEIPTKGPGGKVVRQSDLYQVEGSLNGRPGVFEWIVDQGQVTHRRFIRRGVVTGFPNQRPN